MMSSTNIILKKILHKFLCYIRKIQIFFYVKINLKIYIIIEKRFIEVKINDTILYYFQINTKKILFKNTKKKKKRGELHPLRGNNIKEVQENRSCTSRSGRFRAKVESSVVREKGVRGVAEKGRKRGKMQRTSIDSPSA